MPTWNHKYFSYFQKLCQCGIKLQTKTWLHIKKVKMWLQIDKASEKKRNICGFKYIMCVFFIHIYIYIYILYIYIYIIYIWIFSKLINKSINFTLIRELTTEDSLHIGLSYYIYILPIISFGDCYSVIASVLRFAFFFYSDLIRLSNGFDYLIFVNFAFYFQGQIRFRSFIQALLKYVCVTWQ